MAGDRRCDSDKPSSILRQDRYVNLKSKKTRKGNAARKFHTQAPLDGIDFAPFLAEPKVITIDDSRMHAQHLPMGVTVQSIGTSASGDSLVIQGRMLIAGNVMQTVGRDTMARRVIASENRVSRTT